MIDVATFRGEKVAVHGARPLRPGRGASAARAAAPTVMAWDDAAAKRDAAAAAGRADRRSRARPISPASPRSCSRPASRTLIPKPHPVAARARAAGAEIIGDIELLARSRRQARYVGITGTNGKSTTTALIGHILAQAGRKVAVGGNLGTPALVARAARRRRHLCPGDELLSARADREPRPSTSPCCSTSRPTISTATAAWTAMSPPSAASSRASRSAQTAIIGIDDDLQPRRWQTRSPAGRGVVPISAERARARRRLCRGWLARSTTWPARRSASSTCAAPRGCPARTIGRTPPRPLPRRARSASTPPPSSPASLSFPGLAHRQELVATIDGVAYVNDSARRPTPTRPPRRSPATTRSTGSPAGSPRKAASPRWRRSSRASATPSSSARRREDFAATLDGRVTLEPLRRARPRRRRGARGGARRARSRAPWCCCRRPAPLSTSSPISRSAATPSAASSRRLPGARA